MFVATVICHCHCVSQLQLNYLSTTCIQVVMTSTYKTQGHFHTQKHRLYSTTCQLRTALLSTISKLATSLVCACFCILCIIKKPKYQLYYNYIQAVYVCAHSVGLLRRVLPTISVLPLESHVFKNYPLHSLPFSPVAKPVFILVNTRGFSSHLQD